MLEAAFCDLSELLNPELVLEIGAHEASFSIELKRRLPNAAVIAFEANPYVYAAHESRINSTGLVRYVWQAISDSAADVTLFIPTSVAGQSKPMHNRMGSLKQQTNKSVVETSTIVPGSTLDTAVGAHNGKPAVLWIDVEGAVDRVLAGAKNTMQVAQAVMCELETASIWSDQATHTEILKQMSSYGLTPLLCDCQAPIQYNVILLHERHLSNPGVTKLTEAFVAAVDHLLGGAL